MSDPLPRSEALMEVLPLALIDGTINVCLLGSMALQAGWHASVHPNDVAGGLCREFSLAPVVVHSTSWRHEPGKLFVTYAAVVESPAALPPMLRARPAERKDLARGGATTPPEVIDVGEVVEHALRHLAWLVEDDEAVRDAMPDEWEHALESYPPEPFRSFEAGWK